MVSSLGFLAAHRPKADSGAAQASTTRIVESVGALIAIQRAMDDEVKRRT